MAGMQVDIKVGDAVAAAKGRFEHLASTVFPQAVQFSLNRVVIDGVNRFRREMPIVLRHSVEYTRKGVGYDLDRQHLKTIDSVDDVRSAAYIRRDQSVWLKYAFGEERRPGGDVGIKAYFPNKNRVYLPNASGLATQGIRPNAQGNYKAADMRMLGKAMATGYRPSGGARFDGIFEIKAGDRDPALLGVGVHARPARGTAIRERARVRNKMDRKKRAPRYDSAGNEIRVKDRRNWENRYSLLSAPTTTFDRRDGTSVTVPKVVNMGVPELLFRVQPDATYRPTLTPSWERSLTKAAESMGDFLLTKLADKMQRKAGLH